MNNRLDEEKDLNSLPLRILATEQKLADIQLLHQQIEKLREELYQDELALKYANPEFKKAMDAVTSFGGALQYINTEFKKDKDIVLAAVKSYGMALCYADDDLKKDKEIVKAAVQSNGNALQYAHATFKGNREIVLAAVQAPGWALRHAEPIFFADREVMLHAVQSDSSIFRDADESLKKDGAIAIAAVKAFPHNIEYVALELQESKHFLLEVFSQNGLALGYIDKKSLVNRDLQMAAIRQNPRAMRDSNYNQIGDFDFILTMAKNDGEVLQYVGFEPSEQPKFIYGLWRMGACNNNDQHRMKLIADYLLSQVGYLLVAGGVATLGLLWVYEMLPTLVTIVGGLISAIGLTGVAYMTINNLNSFFSAPKRITELEPIAQVALQ